MDYQLLFKYTPARVLAVTPEPNSYRILDASDAYLDATMTTRDIVSRPTFDVFPDNPGDPSATGTTNLRASFERALASRGTDRMPVQKYDIRDSSGHFEERHWAPVNAAVIAGDGTLVTVIHRVEDVTALVKEGEVLHGEAAHLRHDLFVRARELALANERLRDGADRRLRMVAIVGHDLRGPLMSMGASVAVLRRRFTDLGAVHPRVLDILETNTAHMVELLNDLADYTATQLNGMFSISREHTNLRAICEEVVEAAQLAHPDRAIEMLPGENISAYVDPKRKQQLLTNLINNAVAYGAIDRPVRVAVKRVTGACVITVSNEGEPLPEGIIPALFEPFRRGPGAGTPQNRGNKGLGLGLYIVQQIAHAHGATIHVESTPEGTHFSVYIPVQH